MNQSRAQFHLSLIWADSDIHEFVIHASSKHFSGETSIYMTPGNLANLAELLNGSPSSREDQRTFEIGQADLNGYGNKFEASSTVATPLATVASTSK